jgi:hypothetical protein
LASFKFLWKLGCYIYLIQFVDKGFALTLAWT